MGLPGITGGTPTVGSSSDKFYVLTQKDVDDISKACSLTSSSSIKTREAGFKALFRWIDSNCVEGSWQALYDILCNPKNSKVEDFYSAMTVIGTNTKNADANHSLVLRDLVDMDDTFTVLLLLDAVLAFDVVGETEGCSALLDYLFEVGHLGDLDEEDSLESIPTDDKYEPPTNCPFKVL